MILFANLAPTTRLVFGALFFVVALLFSRKDNLFCKIYVLCCLITGTLMIATGGTGLITCFLRYIGSSI